jgi:predicted ribosome quality control (RQC) complex YloA/Tae2 family protein
MGKHSNIIFCDGDTILDSIKRVSSQMSSVREVLPGRKYFIPNTTGKHNPLAVSMNDFSIYIDEKPMPVSKALYSSFTGISPVSAPVAARDVGI